ncbi:MAG: hypothetical protein CMJ32_11230 [Phycisphaerae bacterium]|nr:hypothetical protein [Phycisphaerae bacterium]
MPKMTPDTIESLIHDAESQLEDGEFMIAQKTAWEGLLQARRIGDYGMMAKFCPLLKDIMIARMADAKKRFRKIRILEEAPDLEDPKPGIYLFQPPVVGADARRLRMANQEAGQNCLVLCREPMTQLGLCPIVAIGPVTVRTRIEPDENHESPSREWYEHALMQLGDAALDSLDRGVSIDRQVDAMLSRLDSVPDHEQMHDVLQQLCEEADAIDAKPRGAYQGD